MSSSSKFGPPGPGESRGPRGLGELLALNSPLGALAKAASSRLELADCVRRTLPGELAAAVANCNLRPDGTLVVTAASPEWASRLRFEADGILEGCRPHWPEAARVKFRVGTDL
ncbi:MAG: DciA family protein [Gammaproteobacteria bacterium]